MRAVPPHALELIQALRQPVGWSQRLVGGEGADGLLDELATFAQPALVPDLLPLVFGAPRRVRERAAEILAQSLADASTTELVWLDEAVRRLGWAHPAQWESEWRMLQPLGLARLDVFGAAAWAALAVACLHANGYVREAAVERLAALRDGRELRFLALRLNDWVAPVAERARRALEARVVPSYGAAWLDALSLLERLGPHTRRDAGDLRLRVLEMLRAPELRPVLRDALASPDRVLRRTAAHLLWSSAPEERGAVLESVLRDADPGLRIRAVAAAGRDLPLPEFRAALPAVMADRFPGVRRAGIAAAARLPDADRWMTAAMLDSSRAVRELARYYLIRSGTVTDLAAPYRAALEAPDTVDATTLAAAAAGLGETGSGGDVPRLLPLLAHERPRVRRAVLRALTQLDPDAQDERLLAALGDPAPGVTHAARDALRLRASRVDASALAARFAGIAPVHGLLDVLAVATSLPKWESLVVLLAGVDARDERVRAEARRRVGVWLARVNRSFTRPTAGQVATLESSLQARGHELPADVRDALRAAIRQWA